MKKNMRIPIVIIVIFFEIKIFDNNVLKLDSHNLFN